MFTWLMYDGRVMVSTQANWQQEAPVIGLSTLVPMLSQDMDPTRPFQKQSDGQSANSVNLWQTWGNLSPDVLISAHFGGTGWYRFPHPIRVDPYMALWPKLHMACWSSPNTPTNSEVMAVKKPTLSATNSHRARLLTKKANFCLWPSLHIIFLFLVDILFYSYKPRHPPTGWWIRMKHSITLKGRLFFNLCIFTQQAVVFFLAGRVLIHNMPLCVSRTISLLPSHIRTFYHKKWIISHLLCSKNFLSWKKSQQNTLPIFKLIYFFISEQDKCLSSVFELR